jgi:hypothetical protein
MHTCATFSVGQGFAPPLQINVNISISAREDVLRQARVYCSDGETESRKLLPAIFAVSAADVTQLAAR